MLSSRALVPLLAAAAALLAAVDSQGTQVYQLTPSTGGLNGNVRLTISGTGFSADQLSYGPGHEMFGNLVWLVSGTRTYVCDVFPLGCTTQQIQCDTRAMVPDTYSLNISVDGVLVPKSQLCPRTTVCQYKPSSALTPILTSVTPLTGPTGSMITICGTIFTCLFGSDLAASTNGLTVKVTRVWAGGQLCEVMANASTPSATPYGCKLDNDGLANTGCLTCQLQGTFVSGLNASILIEGPYGGSQPALSMLRVFGNNDIAELQTYTGVTNVSPSRGSTAGGTLLTISGEHFDATRSPIRATVGGQPCTVVSYNDSQLLCRTGPQPNDANASVQAGGRGLLHELWSNKKVARLTDISSLPKNGTGYSQSRLEASTFSYAFSQVTQTSGFFQTSAGGDYLFQMQSPGGSAALLFSDTGSANDVVCSHAHSQLRGPGGSYASSSLASSSGTFRS